MSLEGAERRRLEKLEASLEEIRHGYNLLLKEEDPVYIKYLDEIDRATEERKRLLNQYKENEAAAAQRMFEGTLYEIGDDEEHERDGLVTSITDYIRSKYAIVQKAMPAAAEFFRPFTNCPFMRVLAGDPTREIVSIDLSDRAFVQEKVMARALKEREENERRCVVEGDRLVLGTTEFPVGTRAVLYNGGGNPMSGAIVGIREGKIDFALDDGRLVAIPVRALNMRLCKLKKK